MFFLASAFVNQGGGAYVLGTGWQFQVGTDMGRKKAYPGGGQGCGPPPICHTGADRALV